MLNLRLEWVHKHSVTFCQLKPLGLLDVSVPQVVHFHLNFKFCH